jgi:hypothetical protein
MTFLDDNDVHVKAALDRIRALRRLTKQTGVKTYKSERQLLESLSADVLAGVALFLDEQQIPTTTKKGNTDELANF